MTEALGISKSERAPSGTDLAGGDAMGGALFQKWLPPLLSVIAGMVDVLGFLTLGNIFPAHVTGNLVVMAAALVRGSPLHLAQALSVPVFILALAALWGVALSSNWRGVKLARLMLWVQFALLVIVSFVSVIAKPSANPRGLAADVAVMIAVSAMASQYALFRLAIPETVSTAAMTGNLTNTVLSGMDGMSRGRALMTGDKERLRRSLDLLIGFLAGCVAGAAAVPLARDWAWCLPMILAALAVVLTTIHAGQSNDGATRV